VLKLDPNPTFKWEVTVKTPEGEETITLIYRHMTVEDHDAWWAAAAQRSRDYGETLRKHMVAVEQAAKDGKELPAMPKPEKSGFDEIMEVVAGWEGVEAEFSPDAMAKVLSNYHDLTAAKICQAWSRGLTQRKVEN
jgi:hypothetical protein